MEHIIKFLIVLFAFSNSILNAQPISFYKEFITGSVELSLFELASVHDGGYILIGSYENVNGGNAIVIKTDSSGNELWRKRNSYFTSLDSTNSYYSVKETEDHGFLLAGYIRILDSSNIFNNQRLLTKIDSIGNTQWQKISGDSSHESYRKIINDTDTTFLALGYKSHTGQGEISLTRFNQFGDSIWNKNYNFQPFLAIEPDFLLKSGDSLLLTFRLRDSANFVYRSGILMTDLNGNFLDSAIFENSSSAQPLSLSIGVLSSFLFLEKKYGIDSKILLYDLNSDLSIMTMDSIPLAYSATIDTAMNIYMTTFSTEFYTTKINEFRDTIWHNMLNEEYLFPNFIMNENGCALICGRKDQDNTTTARGFFLRVCDSTIITEIAILPNSKENRINVSNNDGQIQVTLNDEILNNQDITLLAIDINGKMIQSISHVNNKTIYLTNNLFCSGIYTIVIQSRGKIISTKKFVYN